MSIATVVATRSPCLRRQIGAIIVRDKHIISTGYNGPPSGFAHCADIGGCMRAMAGIKSGTQHDVCRAVHAEQNAIIQAAIHGVSTMGATLYCTNSPCRICAAMIVNAGIKRYITDNQYPDTMGVQTLIDGNVEFLMNL